MFWETGLEFLHFHTAILATMSSGCGKMAQGAHTFLLKLDILWVFSSLYITSLASLVSALAHFRTGSLPRWLVPVILTSRLVLGSDGFSVTLVLNQCPCK